MHLFFYVPAAIQDNERCKAAIYVFESITQPMNGNILVIVQLCISSFR